MKKRIARHVVATAIRNLSSLSSALELYRSYCTNESFRDLHLAVERSAAEISLNLINPMLEQNPELKSEIDQEIGALGKIL